MVMRKILKYCFFDLFRSRWNYIYLGFFLAITSGFFTLGGGAEKVVISLMNISLVLVPLIASMFGIIYYYNSREFTELLLAQPIPRRKIFLGQYLGLGLSLNASFLIGVFVPFLLFGGFASGEGAQILVLMISGVALNFIFVALGFFIALKNENRIRGFGLTILSWLFFAVLYDGIFLILLIIFRDYPLENLSLSAIVLNPIDLARTLILLKLDISALFGYTGAVFEKFLGNLNGMLIASTLLLFWIMGPVFAFMRTAARKDF